MRSFGVRLREERERLGMNQEQIGALGGVNRNTQGKYEKDLRSPDAAYLQALSTAGVDVHYVITGEQRAPEGALSLIDIDFLAEIAEQLDHIISQAGKKPRGAQFVRMVAEVYNFMAQEGTRDAETASRALKLVVNR